MSLSSEVLETTSIIACSVVLLLFGLALQLILVEPNYFMYSVACLLLIIPVGALCSFLVLLFLLFTPKDALLRYTRNLAIGSSLITGILALCSLGSVLFYCSLLYQSIAMANPSN